MTNSDRLSCPLSGYDRNSRACEGEILVIDNCRAEIVRGLAHAAGQATDGLSSSI